MVAALHSEADGSSRRSSLQSAILRASIARSTDGFTSDIDAWAGGSRDEARPVLDEWISTTASMQNTVMSVTRTRDISWVGEENA